MTTPLDRARARLEKLIAEMEHTKNEIADVRKFIEMYKHFEGNDEGGPPAKSKIVLVKRRVTTPIVHAMLEAIDKANRPLTRGELAQVLADEGIEIPSDDKPKYIGTLAWRNSGLFLNVEGRGYWLKGRPLGRLQVTSDGPPPSDQMRHDYNELCAQAAAADRAYYQDEEPIMADAEYNKLRARIGQMESEYPELRNML